MHSRRRGARRKSRQACAPRRQASADFCSTALLGRSAAVNLLHRLKKRLWLARGLGQLHRQAPFGARSAKSPFWFRRIDGLTKRDRMRRHIAARKRAQAVADRTCHGGQDTWRAGFHFFPTQAMTGSFRLPAAAHGSHETEGVARPREEHRWQSMALLGGLQALEFSGVTLSGKIAFHLQYPIPPDPRYRPQPHLSSAIPRLSGNGSQQVLGASGVADRGIRCLHQRLSSG